MAISNVGMNIDTGEKTWLTPRYFFDHLGHFDTDPCVPPDMPWKTADRMYTKEMDGLVQPWYGRVWLNPPYGREAVPFFRRMVAHCENGGGGGHCIGLRPYRHGALARRHCAARLVHPVPSGKGEVSEA